MDGEEFAGTMPVPERQRFDVAALERYLRDHIPGLVGPLRAEQFRGGQSNPTFLLTARDGARYVLRRKPAGQLLPSAHAVDREFRVTRALHGQGVPVAEPICLCEDASVLGTMFYVMGYMQGRNFWDPRLPGMTPAERAALYDEMNRVLVKLHSLDYARVGLGDYGKPGNYFARQITRWSKQYRASETERIEAMENLLVWLPANIPPGDETALVHGDYRIDNMIFAPAEPRMIAVVDWELSTLGHPLGDFAYHLMSWRLDPATFRGLVGADLGALGIPDEAAYVAAYCARTGRTGIAHLDYYLAYNMFRLAAILQGIAKRALDGTASSRDAHTTGARARRVAEAGLRQMERAAAG
jgi:aminoglycoside phosphotransferase (APT) family kinase protein